MFPSDPCLFALGESRAYGARVSEALGVLTDTIPPFRLPPGFLRHKVSVLDTAPLVARAVRCIHEGGSIVDLLEG